MINANLLQKAKTKGTDEEFRAWVRLWPSCLSGAYSEVVDGVGKCEAAHVRRAGSSGIAYKGEYCCIPLTHDEHAMQHQKGESVFCAPEWYDNQAAKYLTMWINGNKPPRMEEQKTHWKKEYIIEYPGQMVVLWLLLKRHFGRKKAPAIKCTLQRAVRRRSNQQNKAQWGVLYGPALEYYKEHPGDLARDTLDAIKFNITEDFIHEIFKRKFNRGESTAKLSTVQSAEYAEKIRHHFLHGYGYEIPEPISPIQSEY